MTGTERDALIAEARRWPGGVGPAPSAPPGDLILRLADAIEREPVVADDPTDWEYRHVLSSGETVVTTYPSRFSDARRRAPGDWVALTPDGQEAEPSR